MAVSRHTYIAPEGWRYIGFILLLAIVSQILIQYWAILIWMLFLLSLFIFRDPSRKNPAAPLAIISPVDGTVIDVATKHDLFLKREAKFISIKMPIFSIFSVRSITEGKVMNQWHHIQDNIKNANSCYAIWIQTDEQDDVVLVLRPGRWFKKIISYFITGERVGQGHRMGYILFGAVIDIYLSESSTFEVAVGTKVYAGSDILAQLVHN